jgi:hypothetical protein
MSKVANHLLIEKYANATKRSEIIGCLLLDSNSIALISGKSKLPKSKTKGQWGKMIA